MVSSVSPRVSVIIPVYNTLDYLPEAIESVLAQDYPDPEIIVVDDGSSNPGADEIVSGFGGRVRFFRKENGGVASARNYGVARAHGDLIALLDQDNRWLPQKLSAQIPLFEDPQVGLVYAGIRFFHTDDGRTLGRYFPGHPLGFHDILGHRVLTTQTLVFRRSVLSLIGGFDESLRGVDDWDACIRASAVSKLIGVDRVLGEARIHGDNSTQKLDMFSGALAVLSKNSVGHAGCRQCAQAVSRARGLLREGRYNALCRRSREALSRRDYRQAAALRWSAIRFAPGIFVRRAWGRLLGG